MSESGYESPNPDEVDGVLGDDEVLTTKMEVSGVTPTIGMKFTSYEEAFDFYKCYGYSMSFPVRKRTSKKNEDGLVRYGVFVCGQAGKRSSSTGNCLKPHPTMQTGCEAKLVVTVDALGSWRVTNVCLDHNHMTSPSKSRLFRCNRQLSEQAKRKLQVNDIAGIPLHKSFNSTVVEAGGYEQLPFVEKDCRNYIEKVRRLRLEDGDATAIQAYFSKMQAQCPGFFFSLDLDEESHLQNVFWADNRCRLPYKEFGDVVTFDTTYLTNRYDMPFAPFVGVNHHGGKINYDGWVCTEEQVRYEQLCNFFAKAANMVVGNKQRTREVIEWIEHLLNETPNSIVTHMAPISGDVGNRSSSPILDPICSKGKGAPRKVRQKGPLETSKKAKVNSKARKMKKPMQSNMREGPPKSLSSQHQ